MATAHSLTRHDVRPIPKPVARLRRTLADDPDFHRDRRDDARFLDPDCEIGAWPDYINQSHAPILMGGGDWHENDEDDDPETGIEDFPHDANEEDGI